MKTSLLHFSSEVSDATSSGLPILALESTIISHGMPYPDNLEFAQQAENIARKQGVVPATIAIIGGKIQVGLNEQSLDDLTLDQNINKVAVRDIATTVACKQSGATTVSATMHIAHSAGIEVFATGGIGGVHRNGEKTLDISQDLRVLGNTPLVVVSAGVKAMLDIPLTLEYLETEGITVIGYQTDVFPAFYSRESGCSVPARANSPVDIVAIHATNKTLKIISSILVVNPIPVSHEIPYQEMEGYINIALDECTKEGIRGKMVTPYLLKKIVALTSGRSLHANIKLALNNVTLGAQIAKALKQQD